MSHELAPRGSRREIHQAEALGWLAARGLHEGESVITSLPDVSEVPELGFEGWRRWFEEAARAVLAALPARSVAIFYQSDIRHEGLWVDKGHLVQRAADGLGVPLLWHRIVCRKPAGTITFGRASYSHLLAFSKALRPPLTHGRPDVLPSAGQMPWSKAMGVEACLLACDFLRRETDTHTVVDPFCGYGTALAIANALGLDAIGVDLSARKCKRARALSLALPPPAPARE
jgi:hypothetical protein